MYIADVYKSGVGTIKKIGKFQTLQEVQTALQNYCEENNVHVRATERCDTATWNYLSDGTEFDYCLEE